MYGGTGKECSYGFWVEGSRLPRVRLLVLQKLSSVKERTGSYSQAIKEWPNRKGRKLVGVLVCSPHQRPDTPNRAHGAPNRRPISRRSAPRSRSLAQRNGLGNAPNQGHVSLTKSRERHCFTQEHGWGPGSLLWASISLANVWSRWFYCPVSEC